MSDDSVTVLDLGSTRALALSAAMGPQGNLKVKGLASVECRGVKKGIVADVEEASRAIDAVMRRLQQHTHAPVGPVVVSVSGAHVEGTSAQGFKPIVPKSRSITHQDVLEVVNHSRSLLFPPDREQIQAIPREFRVDGQRNVKQPVGMTGGKLEVVTYLVSGQIPLLQSLERSVTLAGFTIEQMVLAPLAAGLGVLTQDELEAGTLLVDIGGGKTDIAIFSGGSIAYSASLPIGASLVTSDLSTLLRTSPEEAERLKVESGGSVASAVSEAESVQVSQIGQPGPRPMQRKVLCEIIEARMRELARLVSQQLDRSGYRGLLPGGVILTGGGSLLPHTAQLFEESLEHMRVRLAEPMVPQGPAYGKAVAVGLAKFALQCREELAPANGTGDWRERIRSLWSNVSGKGF